MRAYFDDTQINKKRGLDLLLGHRLKRGGGSLWTRCGDNSSKIKVQQFQVLDRGEGLEILNRLPLLSLRVSFWPFSLSKPWRALCFVFNKEAVPFSCGMYSLKYPVPGAHGHRVGSSCSQEPHFLCFHFSSQIVNQTSSSCFWVWDVGRSHSRVPLANRSEGASENCP